MERQPNRAEHEGDKYLEMLGLSSISDRRIKTEQGFISARDFLDICGDTARLTLVGLEKIGPHDPRYGESIEAIRTHVLKSLQIEDR
jgi:hypothetical protein